MYMGSDLFQPDSYDSRGDVATKYENYLPVDDLLAPMFFVRESEFLLFLPLVELHREFATTYVPFRRRRRRTFSSSTSSFLVPHPAISEL